MKGQETDSPEGPGRGLNRHCRVVRGETQQLPAHPVQLDVCSSQCRPHPGLPHPSPVSGCLGCPVMGGRPLQPGPHVTGVLTGLGQQRSGVSLGSLADTGRVSFVISSRVARVYQLLLVKPPPLQLLLLVRTCRTPWPRL